jgi:hypothetical protein
MRSLLSHSLFLSRSLFLVALVAFTSAGCRFGPFHVVRGNGHIVQEDRSVGPFQSIESNGFMNIYLIQGATTGLRLEGESNVLKYIDTRVEDGKLIVGTLHDINLDVSHDLNVYVTLPKLTDVTLSGSGNIIGKNELTSDQPIEFTLSGSGSVKADVDAPQVKSMLNGSGKVELQGQTKDLKVEIAGSADFFGDELKSENAHISILGSGSAHVFSSVKLDVTIAGSGDIYYAGDPALSSNIYGSGTLKKK